MTRRHYKRPPIVEAIIDIHVEPPPGFDANILSTALDDERQAFPTKGRLDVTAFTFNVDSGTQEPVDAQLRGFQFTSADGRFQTQFRRDGFSVHRQAPYDRWEELRDKGRRLWDKYLKVVRPSVATRAAVRYLNRLDIPIEQADLREFILCRPEIPEGMPRRVGHFLMRLDFLVDGLPSTRLAFSQGRVPPPREGIYSVLLDYDVYSTVQLPTSGDSLWQLLEQLHSIENEFFEACMTDKARTLFED